MADIFREVEEDLRRENFRQLWKKYGALLVGVALFVVIAAAAYVGWREWRAAESREFAGRLAAAGDMADSGNVEQAIAAYEALAEEADGGYEILARLYQAALTAENGDRESAIAIYDALAGDSDTGSPYRDLGALLAVMHGMDGGGDPAALIDRLAPLTSDDNAWRYSARELTALLERRRGNRERAIELFVGLEQDANAPPNLRARAREMLAAMGHQG